MAPLLRHQDPGPEGGGAAVGTDPPACRGVRATLGLLENEQLCGRDMVWEKGRVRMGRGTERKE